MYAVHLRLTGKHIVDFLLIELFSLGATAEVLGVNIEWKSPFLKVTGHSGPKFQVERDVLHQLFFVSEKQLHQAFIWYKNVDRSFFRFVTMHVFDGRTDAHRKTVDA